MAQDRCRTRNEAADNKSAKWACRRKWGALPLGPHAVRQRTVDVQPSVGSVLLACHPRLGRQRRCLQELPLGWHAKPHQPVKQQGGDPPVLAGSDPREGPRLELKEPTWRGPELCNELHAREHEPVPQHRALKPELRP